MSFTDEDLKRLKEKALELDWSYNEISSKKILSLLARLESAEQICYSSYKDSRFALPAAWDTWLKYKGL